MNRYLSGQALVAKCRAGRGAIVVLEGETEHDDPYFYGRWFGDLAREVSFEPQNGWEKVVVAVKELREAIPDRPVFGIVDRDFADEAVVAGQERAVPIDGVFRTRRYTLENYLLDPVGWAKCAAMMRRGTAPEPWASVDGIAAKLAEAYRACAGVAAWNWVVSAECRRDPQSLVGSPGHREHPDALPKDPEQVLLTWGLQRAAPRSLAEEFSAHLARVRQMDVQEQSCWVTGKAVLKVFLRDFPVPVGPRIHNEVLTNLYLNAHPTPPGELAGLVRRIITLAGR